MTMSPRRSSRLARGISVALLSAASAVALSPTTASAATDAIVADSGCTTNDLGANDDGSSAAIALPSTLKFYDREVSTAFVNNNGNITFNAALSSFSGHISTLSQPLVAPFFSDLDTRGTQVPVTYGTTTFGDRPALCANWHDIGFFSNGTDPTNDFQALIVDRSDVEDGDFDVVFNYNRVDGDYAGDSQIGFSSADGSSEHVYVFPGSSTAGAFLDSSETGLVHGSRESEVLGRYVFRFRGGFPVGVTPPDTTITSTPATRSGDTDASFTYSSSAAAGEHRRFECRLTATGAVPGVFTTCPDDGIDYTGLNDGGHTFEVRAVDAFYSTDATPASSTFEVDTTGPETQIDSAPAALSNDGSPSFTYSSSSSDAESFECTLNRPDSLALPVWETCEAAGTDLTDLDDGDWTFQVRAIDDLGNEDPTPASHDFTIDTEATGVSIETAPDMRGSNNTPSFTYLGDPADDVVSFECFLVPADAGSATPSTCDPEGFTSEELEDGDYTFGVRATDRAGNVGDTATYDFTVDTVAGDTRVTSAPRALGNDTTPSFTYDSDAEDIDFFECRLVGAGAKGFVECDDAGMSFGPLVDGDYTFQVRSVDGAGNLDPTPAEHEFTIDTVVPETTITTAPAAVVGTSSVTFGYATDKDPATFECRLSTAGQTGAWQACQGTSKTFSGLVDGGYTFEVRATDAAGNTDATPATGKVDVNVGRPTIVASLASELPVSAFGWHRSPVTITYTCAGNGSALVGACPAPRLVPRAQRGRTFTAAIRTADGDSASVSTTLFIDKGRPNATIKGFSGKKAYRSVPKSIRCVASDPRSGLDDCTVSVTKVKRRNGHAMIVVRAKATDRAGNVRVVKKKARLRAS